jgi:arylsulfatase A
LGGKGTTTMWGTHVPGIGNWPGHWASGKVCTDLIDATDFLPTIAKATNSPIPNEAKLDGRSFLPQLCGEKGNPRDFLYAWYNPSGGAKAKAEFTHDQQFKLYSNGEFYDTTKDDNEKHPLADDALDEKAKRAKAKLQAGLKQYDGPRDPAFVKQSQAFGGEGGDGTEPTKGKGKGKGKKAKK